MTEKAFFYLKRPDAPQTSVFCLFFHDGKKTKIYTSISVDTKHWDTTEQKAKTRRGNPAGEAVNAELKRVADTLAGFYMDCRAKGYIPSDNDLRQCIKPVQSEDRQLGFWQAWEQYYEAKATTKAMRQKLDAIRSWLQSFEVKHPLHLDNVSWKTLDDLQAHLTRKGLQLSTVAKHTAFVKSFLHWCVNREITANVKWQRFSIQAPPDTLKVALSRAEIDRLRNTPLPNESLANCRDLFIIGCLTGLRFSDYTRIKPEHIKGGTLVMRQEKTDGFVEIPLTDEAAELAGRLATGQLRVITNQRMNGYLKQVCKLCGIDEAFEVSEFRGKIKVTKTVPKWQMIGTHTARRTFATNLLLAGIPAQGVMQYTGHKDYKSFSKYVNIPKQSQHESVRDAIRLMA